MSLCNFRAGTKTHWPGSDSPLRRLSEKHKLLKLTCHHLISLSQAIQTLLRKRKSHTIGILEDTLQWALLLPEISDQHPGDHLRGWVGQKSPGSGGSSTSTSGHPAPLLHWVPCPAMVSCCQPLLTSWLGSSHHLLWTGPPPLPYLSPMVLVFTMLSDMTVCVVYCLSTPDRSFQRTGSSAI